MYVAFLPVYTKVCVYFHDVLHTWVSVAEVFISCESPMMSWFKLVWCGMLCVLSICKGYFLSDGKI